MSTTITLPVTLDSLEWAEGVRIMVEIDLDPETGERHGYAMVLRGDGWARHLLPPLPLSDRCLDELTELALEQWRETEGDRRCHEARDMEDER